MARWNELSNMQRSLVVSLLVMLLQLSGIKYPKYGASYDWPEFIQKLSGEAGVIVGFVTLAVFLGTLRWPQLLRFGKG